MKRIFFAVVISVFAAAVGLHYNGISGARLYLSLHDGADDLTCGPRDQRRVLMAGSSLNLRLHYKSEMS
jgi:hypothetical protein